MGADSATRPSQSRNPLGSQNYWENTYADEETAHYYPQNDPSTCTANTTILVDAVDVYATAILDHDLSYWNITDVKRGPFWVFAEKYVLESSIQQCTVSFTVKCEVDLPKDFVNNSKLVFGFSVVAYDFLNGSVAVYLFNGCNSGGSWHCPNLKLSICLVRHRSTNHHSPTISNICYQFK